MATSQTHNGWHWDPGNSRLDFYYRGTRIGHIDASGVQALDDMLLAIGTGGTARFSWDTTDANANELLLQMPAGGSVDVPVLVIAQAVESVDLGLYNGVVDPRVALLAAGAVTTGPILEFRKGRGTIAAPTVNTAGDDCGQIIAYTCVANGEYVQGAAINFDAVATQATTRGPMTITFRTATDAAPSVLTTALTIGKDQSSTFAGTVALGANNLTMSGTISVTGTRVTQSYHTNITSTNAVTVDSSETVKTAIKPYAKKALDIIRGLDVITFQHQAWLDPSGATKLGVRAESVSEPLAVQTLEREDGSEYPGVNLYGLIALLVKAVQELAGDAPAKGKRAVAAA